MYNKHRVLADDQICQLVSVSDLAILATCQQPVALTFMLYCSTVSPLSENQPD